MNEDSHIEKILEYYMGKNTPERQEFIIERLRVDIDQLKPSEIGGETLVESEEGKGTHITMILPLFEVRTESDLHEKEAV